MLKTVLTCLCCCVLYSAAWAQTYPSAIAFFEATERLLLEDRTEAALLEIQTIKADPPHPTWLAFAQVLEGSHLTNQMDIPGAQAQFDSVQLLLAPLEADAHPDAQRIRWEYLYYQGLLYMNTQRFKEARQRWDKGIDDIKATFGEAHFALVKFYVGAGALYGQTGNGRLALQLLQQAHTLTCQQSPIDSFTLANVNLNLGTMYANFGNAQSAAVYLEEAATYFSSAVGNDYSQTSMALSAWGDALTSLGDYERGVQLQEQAIQQFISAFGEEYYYLVYAYYFSHKAYALAGRYEEALIVIEKAAKLAKALFGPQDFTYAQMLALQANTTMNTSRTEGVKALLDTAQHISNAMLAYNTDLKEMVLFSYPRYYTIKGMRQAAIQAYHEAIDFLPDNPSDLQRVKAVQAWRSLGNLYEREVQYDQAEAALLRSIAEVRAFEHKHYDWLYSYAQSLLEAAEFYVNRAQYDKALPLLDTVTTRAMPFQSTMSNLIIQAEALRAAALLDRDPARASQCVQGAVATLQDLRTTTLQANKLSEQGHHLYAVGIATYAALDQPEALYDCFERSHAATLQLKAQERTAQANSDLPLSLRDREATLKAELARIEKAIYLGQDTAGSTLTLQLLEARAALRDFRQQLRNDYPQYRKLLQVQPILPLAELQARLAPDELLLHYHWSSQRQQVARLTITRNQTQLDFIPLSHDLEQAVRDIHDQVQSPAVARADRRKALETACRDVAALLPDLAQYPKVQRLTIIPDGPLFYLPFELLPVGDQYLIERYTVAYRYTASPLFPRTTPTDYKASLYAFAPVFSEESSSIAPDIASNRDTLQRAIRDGRFVPLRYSAIEVKNLQALFPDAVVHLREDATRQQLSQALSASYRMVHIASHSFANLFRAQLSGIACTSPDPDAPSILYATDIYSLSANADLVTLSSCESGLGTIKQGEAMLGINHGLMYAGVPHVIASLWKVNDRFTAEFMTNLYAHIAAGKDYARALQLAKVEMIRSDVAASPNVWAAFLLMSAD